MYLRSFRGGLQIITSSCINCLPRPQTTGWGRPSLIYAAHKIAWREKVEKVDAEEVQQPSKGEAKGLGIGDPGFGSPNPSRRWLSPGLKGAQRVLGAGAGWLSARIEMSRPRVPLILELNPHRN